MKNSWSQTCHNKISRFFYIFLLQEWNILACREETINEAAFSSIRTVATRPNAFEHKMTLFVATQKWNPQLSEMLLWSCYKSIINRLKSHSPLSTLYERHCLGKFWRGSSMLQVLPRNKWLVTLRGRKLLVRLKKMRNISCGNVAPHRYRFKLTREHMHFQLLLK